FLSGLQGRPELLDESLEFTREAIKLDPDNPNLRYNLGLALLAAGKKEEARRAYETGVLRTIFLDFRENIWRDNPDLEEAYVGGALTDLEILAAARKGMSKEVLETKELIVESVAAGELGPPRSNASVSRIDALVFPAQTQFSIEDKDFDPEGDLISVQWYQKAPGFGWVVVPEASGVTELLQDSEGQYFAQGQYLARSFPPRCLPEGEYRVELYVYGRLAGQGHTKSDFRTLQASLDRDLNIAACRPADWIRSAKAEPGLMNGYLSPDGSRGVYIVRTKFPSAYKERELREGLERPGELELVLRLFMEARTDLFPAPPAFNRVIGDGGYFLRSDLGPTRFEDYRYEGGRVAAGAGMEQDGNVFL
ncbi:MAG: tetratricopeptide repeat protein, partial [Candidatus Methylomirabilales bacterium]